jgi:hypothetical protein
VSFSFKNQVTFFHHKTHFMHHFTVSFHTCFVGFMCHNFFHEARRYRHEVLSSATLEPLLSRLSPFHTKKVITTSSILTSNHLQSYRNILNNSFFVCFAQNHNCCIGFSSVFNFKICSTKFLVFEISPVGSFDDRRLV